MSAQIVKTKQYRPTGGVTLKEGMLRDLFVNNQEYLLRHFTVNDMLNLFYRRAGKPAPERDHKEVEFWESELEGSNAGRFLMGAGYTLCYEENPELRKWMDQLIEGVGECAEPDGFCLGFPKSHMMIMERINYSRTYLTRGLVAALAAGNKKAGQLLRAQQEWFHQYPHKHKIMELHLAWQGMLADTDAGLSDVGSPQDALAAEEAYVKKEWLDRIVHGDTKAIWLCSNDSTHSNELIAFFSYAQLYLLTGNPLYYKTIRSVWEMFRKYWIHEGGTIALCEEHDGLHSYYPGSRHVSPDRHTGELCPSVMWMQLNDILLQLEPENEEYAFEIERSLYNAILPSQLGSDGIRYHVYLHGVKDRATHMNTCCEGTGTQIYGMLPAFVYRLHSDDDGATIQLFAASRLERDGYSIEMDTAFPRQDDVIVTVRTDRPMNFPLKIRVPGWMDGKMEVFCDGKLLGEGTPGSYLSIDRQWQGETVLSFCLKRSLKVMRYEGASVVRGYERYCLMNGPVLMAVTGPSEEIAEELVGWPAQHKPDRRSCWNFRHWIMKEADPTDPESFLHDPKLTVKPYYEVEATEEFTCYPLVPQKAAETAISPEESFRTGLRRSVSCQGMTLELMGIPAGSFEMGQEGFTPCELPVHTETVEKPFFMGVFPVTQKQYEAVMGHNPSHHPDENAPVEMVSFYDALAFIDRLNSLQSELRFYLPSEKEWEYASRAGSKDICGYATDDLTEFHRYCWGIDSSASKFYPRPVGQKLQNAWGLYDTMGNAGEWCADIYRSYDPDGFCAPGLRVVRGGSIADLNTTCRCGTRNAMEPEWKNMYYGFRVAAVPVK